jgi:predicted pyridoxine 5'-phosphate oxidase superfamily flavin-nucleotide-binding protein
MSRPRKLDDEIKEFMESQPIFFVATAPLSASGHVNCSPKGGQGTFKVIGEKRVAYLDLTGSGAETAAHLRENGRITIMFASFGARPMIVRIYGRGRYLELSSSGSPVEADLFKPFPAGTRGLVVVDVQEVRSSCGYGVPVASELVERDRLFKWAEAKGADGLASYRAKNNRVSLDGMESLRN